MNRLYILCLLFLVFISCQKEKEYSSVDPVIWENRTVTGTLPETLEHGSSYLSIYSQIYSVSQHGIYDLTATVSMRNPNRADSIFIEKAEYFNTEGSLIRTYFNKPIYLAPLETVEIVIDAADTEGGTGANFIFEWRIKPTSVEPLFEGVMISTYGQQGLSFTTQGKRILVNDN